ncbi:MAG TPA: hypothetical protein VIP77_09740 [Jiangellaceae bacterium]
MIEVGLIIVVVLAVLVTRYILRRGVLSQPPVEQTLTAPEITLDLGLQDQVRTLAARGNAHEATKLLRKQAGLSDGDATAAVHALLTGHVFPSSTPPQPTHASAPVAEAAPEPAARATRVPKPSKKTPIDGETLAMLHELVAQDPDHRAAAILLLRQRTGMSDKDARRFVNAL